MQIYDVNTHRNRQPDRRSCQLQMVEGEEEGDGQKEEGSRLFIIEDTFLLLPPKQSAVTAHLTVSIFMCVAVNF